VSLGVEVGRLVGVSVAAGEGVADGRMMSVGITMSSPVFWQAATQIKIKRMRRLLRFLRCTMI
jgi:hypothetical protein